MNQSLYEGAMGSNVLQNFCRSWLVTFFSNLNTLLPQSSEKINFRPSWSLWVVPVGYSVDYRMNDFIFKNFFSDTIVSVESIQKYSNLTIFIFKIIVYKRVYWHDRNNIVSVRVVKVFKFEYKSIQNKIGWCDVKTSRHVRYLKYSNLNRKVFKKNWTDTIGNILFGKKYRYR
jgi:hypothetical protein